MATAYPIQDPNELILRMQTEIDGEPLQTVFPKTRAMLTTNVQPAAAAPRNPIENYRSRAAELYGQGSELYNREPDMSAIEAYARQRGASGNAAMINALAAQFAGEQFQPVQAQYLKRAAAAQDPIKFGSGMMTPDGKFIKDPEAAQNKKAEFLMQQARAYEQLAQTAQTAQERAQAQAMQQEFMNQIKMMQLEVSRQGLALRERGIDNARLPYTAVQDLASKAAGVDSIAGLYNSFQDKYAAGAGGVPGVGSAQNWVGRNLPIDAFEEQANWWQNYNEQANKIRHELFGSALTQTEKAAFEAAMINPDMKPEMIRSRLAQQATVANRAYEKLVSTARASGYNTSGAPTVSVPPTGTKPGVVQKQGSGGLNPAEQAEYEALRKKHRGQ